MYGHWAASGLQSHWIQPTELKVFAYAYICTHARAKQQVAAQRPGNIQLCLHHYCFPSPPAPQPPPSSGRATASRANKELHQGQAAGSYVHIAASSPFFSLRLPASVQKWWQHEHSFQQPSSSTVPHWLEAEPVPKPGSGGLGEVEEAQACNSQLLSLGAETGKSATTDVLWEPPGLH